MSSRWKKVWADFWLNRTRSTLTILIIVVGVFAVGFNSNLGLFMNRDMDGDFLSVNPSEARIYASPLDDESVNIALRMKGVDAVEGRTQTTLQLVTEQGKLIPTEFTSVKSIASLTLNQLKPADRNAETIPSLLDKEVLFDRSAASLGYKPGDQISFEMVDGKRRVLRLAGYVHDVTSFPFTFSNQVTAYVTPETMEWLGGPSDYTQLLLSVSEKQTDQKHVEGIAQAISDRLERGGSTIYFVFVYQPGHHFAWSVTRGVVFVLSTLGWITVVLSSILVVNTVTALVTQQTKQIGIMKATGGGILQILGMYSTLILLFGFIAVIISIPLAALAGYYVSAGLAAWLNFDIGPVSLYPETVFLQLAIAFIVPLLSALYPILRGVRMTVREAISDYGISGTGKTNTATINRSALLLPRPIRISLRNVFRRKTRLLLTLFTLILAGAIFIGVYNLWASFDQTMKEIEGYYLADLNLSLDRAYRYKEVAAIAESLPAVDNVEGWAEISGTYLAAEKEDEAGIQILFIAPPSSSKLIKPIITSGRWLTASDENAVVIGNHLLNVYPDIKIGDWLDIKINEKESSWQVIGIYKITGNVVPPILYTNYEYISRLVEEPGKVYSLRIITTEHDGETQANTLDEILERFNAHGIKVTTSSISTDWRAQQRAQTDVLVYFMLVMAILIAVVGGLGLMGTMSLNVLERTREIGVMRAIGASNWNIQAIVISEGVAIGLISWLASILLSFPISNVLCFGVGTAIMGSPMPTTYDATGILVWLAGILFIGSVSSILPALRASRLTVKDTLAYE